VTSRFLDKPRPTDNGNPASPSLMTPLSLNQAKAASCAPSGPPRPTQNACLIAGKPWDTVRPRLTPAGSGQVWMPRLLPPPCDTARLQTAVWCPKGGCGRRQFCFANSGIPYPPTLAIAQSSPAGMRDRLDIYWADKSTAINRCTPRTALLWGRGSSARQSICLGDWMPNQHNTLDGRDDKWWLAQSWGWLPPRSGTSKAGGREAGRASHLRRWRTWPQPCDGLAARSGAQSWRGGLH
jgi:hypothetical protein